jgi:hypothetical protein
MSTTTIPNRPFNDKDHKYDLSVFLFCVTIALHACCHSLSIQIDQQQQRTLPVMFYINPTNYSHLCSSSLVQPRNHFYHFSSTCIVPKMPFLIRPPPESSIAEEPSYTLTLIDPDHNDRSILQDLKRWGWRINRHDFDDDEFIEALKQAEQDLKKQRRHAHAVGKDMVGYTPRPTLEDVWHDEAERMLLEEAYEHEKEERQGEAEMYVSAFATPDTCSTVTHRGRNWLRHIDRTRQTNGFLDYVDRERERPRLVTRGLDHRAVNAEREPARVHYFDDCHRSRSARIFTTAANPRPRSILLFLRRPMGCLVKSSQVSEDDRSIRVTTDINLTSVAEQDYESADDVDSTNRTPSNSLPLPPPRASTTPIPPRLSRFHEELDLIFPGSPLDQRAYIRHTGTDIPLSQQPDSLYSAAPSLHRAGLGVDPYGWDAWDEQRQRNENAKAVFKFFVGRERRSLNSRARERMRVRRGSEVEDGVSEGQDEEVSAEKDAEAWEKMMMHMGFGGFIG